MRRERPTRFSGIFVFLEEEDNYQGARAACFRSGDYLTVLYSGTHQESAPALQDGCSRTWRSGAWLRPGDAVEITWIDSGFTQDVSQYVTELQLPVREG